MEFDTNDALARVLENEGLAPFTLLEISLEPKAAGRTFRRAWPCRGEHGRIHQDVDAFIEAQRSRCLWFLRDDFRPTGDAAGLQALDAILRLGDRADSARASELKRGPSPASKNASADS